MPLLTHEQQVAIIDAVKRFHTATERRRICVGWKLDPEKVRQIRQSSLTQTELAEQFGVNQKTISMVQRRKRWKEVD